MSSTESLQASGIISPGYDMSSNSNDELIQTGADSDLAHLIRTCPRLGRQSGIILLSDRFLAKNYQSGSADDTIEAVKIARQLGICVPRIVRSVQCDDNVFVIMDRIQGNTLEKVWTNLGWFATFRLALQLRRFILTLRSMTSTAGGSLITGECRSFWLDDHYRLPPRPWLKDISAFLRFWVEFTSIRQELKKNDDTQKYARVNSVRHLEFLTNVCCM